MYQPINIQPLLLSSLLLFGSFTHANTSSAIEPVQDRVLSNFIHNALVTHPVILAEMAAVEARKAEQRAAGRAVYNPELELDAESATDDTFSIGVNQTIDFGNKRSARKKIATSKHTLSKTRLTAVKNNVCVNLLKALAEFHSAANQLRLADSRLQIVAEFADLAERKYRAGDLSQTEASLASLSLIQAKIDVATQRSVFAEAEQSLRLQSQVLTVSNWPQLPTDLPSLTADLLDTNQLVATLPEVLAAQNEIAVSAGRIDLRQRERKPDPTIGLRGGEEGSDTLVGINLSIPLFVRNSFDAEVAMAQAEQLEAEYRYQNILNSAHTRLLAATTRFQSTRNAWITWQESGQVGHEKQTNLLKRLWEAGELSTTDYLVQLNQILDMQASATELRHQLWRAWFDWLTTSGEVSHWLGLGE